MSFQQSAAVCFADAHRQPGLACMFVQPVTHSSSCREQLLFTLHCPCQSSQQMLLNCVQTAAATATVGNSMATASAAMASVGQAANPAKMAQTMQQFAKENAKMDMASEMMGDAVDDALDDDEVEDETDDLMNQVCGSSSCFFHAHITQFDCCCCSQYRHEPVLLYSCSCTCSSS